MTRVHAESTAAELSIEWPLSRERQELITMLAEMIRQCGPARFTTARLVAADRHDFPDRWEPTLTAVHTVLYRLCWHAHIDPEIVLADRRPATPPEHRMLTSSEIELASTSAGVATFHVAAIGNDDVAGLLSHKLGQAFLELQPGDPFRTAGKIADEREGSVAAVFLGLGVLVANSSMYRRHATKVVGRNEVSEQHVEQVGGLSIADATMLLAIQDLVRDDYQDALDTLHGPQRDWVEQWRDALEPHEHELRAMLGLDVQHDAPPLSRPARPRIPSAVAEPDLRKFNRGQFTFRVRDRSWWPLIGGSIISGVGTAIVVAAIVGPGSTAATALLLGLLPGGAFGLRYCKPYFYCTDPACSRHMATELAECPGCGGTIAETLEHPNDRLDRLEELEAARGIDDAELVAAALAAGDDANANAV